MILKFDHIAFSCDKKAINDFLKLIDGYETVFYEEGIENPRIKEALMASFQNNHTIALMEKQDNLPIEITAYDITHKGEPKYRFSCDIPHRITVNTWDENESISFYKSIGFTENCDRMLKMSFAVGLRHLELQIVKNYRPTENKLDTEGYCCLAFVTNDVKKEKRRLEERGLCVTDIGTVQLNNRIMEVFFANNAQGDTCEFIQICKKK